MFADNNLRVDITMNKKPTYEELEQRIKKLKQESLKQRQVEEVLRKRENNFQFIYDVVGSVIFQIAVEPNDCFRFVTINQSFLDATGLTKKQIVGKRIEEVIPEPSCALVLEKYKESIQLKKPVNWEETSVYPSGVKTGDVTIIPVFNEEKACTHLIGSVHDITERKKTEELLRRQAQVIDQIHDCVIMTDLDGYITFWNNGAFRLYGYTPEEAIGKNVSLLYYKKDLKVLENDVIRPLLGKGEHDLELKVRHKTGKDMIVHLSLSLLRDSGDNITGMVGYTLDITKRKKAEKELLEYQKKLRSLASKLSLTEERERRKIATELHDYIGQSLAMSKIKLKKFQESISSADQVQPLEEINQYIEEAMQHTRSIMSELSPHMLYDLGFESAIEWLIEQFQKKHKIVFSLKYNSRIKLLNNHVSSTLFQSVRELLVNVVKHAQAHSVEVSIQRDGKDIRINVIDDGVGFDVPETIYSKSITSGFGVFNIREQLESINGRLEVESKPSKGTRITLVAPLQR